MFSSDFFTIEQSIGGQFASNPPQEQERIRMEDFRFERHQPDRMNPSYLLRRGIESSSTATEETESAYARGGTSGSVEIVTSRHHIPHIR